jgi:Sulfite exporter TauE/SafE
VIPGWLEYDVWSLVLGAGAGLACGFLNTAASSGSAVSLPILMIIGLDPISANATNRVPVLIGAVSATVSFNQHKVLPWGLAVKVSLPVVIGGLGVAALAEILPGRELALVITAAILVALVLLLTKLKQAIESASSDKVRYGVREFFLFIGIGGWLGFIVLDGATYLLLALNKWSGSTGRSRRRKMIVRSTNRLTQGNCRPILVSLPAALLSQAPAVALPPVIKPGSARWHRLSSFVPKPICKHRLASRRMCKV